MLLPSPDDDYSDFRPVDVLDNDIALLPIDGYAGAFKYKKTLALEVPASLFGDTVTRSIKWEWAFRVRESLDPDSPIIFMGEVEWTANIIGFNMGGLFFVTWSPGGDGGSGKIKTTIINGEAVNPAEAWKFIDVPNPTMFSESGYTVFTPEGVATAGYIYFFADWYSPAWLQELPEGAVLDANDSTTFGNISDEATYEVSTKAAATQVDAVFDNHGALLHAATRSGDAFFALAYEDFTSLRGRAVITGAREASLNRDKHGQIWAMVKEGNAWNEWLSQNGGHTVERKRAVWPQGIQMARAVILKDGRTRLTTAVDGYNVLARTSADNYTASIPVGRLDKKQAVTPVQDKSGKLFAVGESGALFVSTTGGQSWVKRGTTVEEQVEENTIIVRN